MNPERVFSLLSESNPVPDLDAVPEALGLSSNRLHVVDPGRELMQTKEPISRPAPVGTLRTRRWIPAAAAAVIAVIAVGVVAVVLNDGNRVAADPTVARVDTAIATAEEFLAAINAGDVDRLIALSNPEATDVVRDRSMWEMNAVATTGDYPLSVGVCESALVAEGFVDVHCDVTFSDPVFEAEGMSALVFPLRVFDDGTTAWEPYQGGDISVINKAYADYLKAFHAADYEAVCSPGAGEAGTFMSDKGLALTGACASLWVPLSPDVATWVRDGKPAP